MNRTLLIIIAIGAIFFIYKKITNGQKEKTVINMLKSSEKTVIVDVRTSEEFRGGHISNSINIPLDKISSSAEQLRDYDHVIVVCASGMRSAQAASILKSKGFTNVVNGGSWTSLKDIASKN